MAFGDSSSWLSGGITGSKPSDRYGRGPQVAQSGYFTDASGNQVDNPYPTFEGYGDLQRSINKGYRLQDQSGVMGNYYDVKGQGLQADYQNQLAALGLQGQTNAIDRGGNNRDIAYFDAMKAQAAAERANVGDQNNNQLATQGRQINSAATAGGSWFGPGRNDQISDAYKNWGTANKSADISYQRDILGLDRSRANANDQNAKLDIMSKQLGLDRDKLKTSLDQGLNNLGYDRYTSVNSLLDAMDSNDSNTAAIARQVIQQLVTNGYGYNSGQMGDQYDSYLSPYGSRGGRGYR